MKVDFNNKWFRDTCEEYGLDPDNELSKSAIALAYQCALKIKLYLDALNVYEYLNDEELNQKIIRQIDRLNNERIEHMLNALFYAEVVAGLGKDYNKFLRRQLIRKEHLLSRR